MSKKKVWLITGAGRGLGVDIAKGRPDCRTCRCRHWPRCYEDHANLLAIKLDVTRP